MNQIPKQIQRLLTSVTINDTGVVVRAPLSVCRLVLNSFSTTLDESTSEYETRLVSTEDEVQITMK